LDVAHEIENCIANLEEQATWMQFYDKGSEEYVKAWKAFRGSLSPSDPDCLERRLRKAEQA
jgi:hypothetical protein